MAKGLTVFAMMMLGSTAAFAQTVTTQRIDFKQPDRDATSIARSMYGEKYPHVVAERFWLIDQDEGAVDQLALQLGQHERCAGDCEVAVLYHTENGWAEIWRETGRTIGVGEMDDITGLKSIVHANRSWEWDGQNYYPMPVGDVPEYRQATEGEMQVALDWIKENLSLPDSVAPPNLNVVDMNLKDGNEKAIFIQGTAFCGNDECPVLIVDGDEVLTEVSSLGPDVRQGTGLRDTKGYRMVEVMHALSIDVVSPGTGQTVMEMKAEPVVRAGESMPDEEDAKAGDSQ